MLPEPHPDLPAAYHTLKQIQRGSMQAIEDNAIAAYLRAYEVEGKDEAEMVYISFFNKQSHEQRLRSTTNRKANT